jgi:hypothetical protein
MSRCWPSVRGAGRVTVRPAQISCTSDRSPQPLRLPPRMPRQPYQFRFHFTSGLKCAPDMARQSGFRRVKSGVAGVAKEWRTAREGRRVSSPWLCAQPAVWFSSNRPRGPFRPDCTGSSGRLSLLWFRPRVASRHPIAPVRKQCPIERPADYLLFINPQLARFQPVDHL